MTSDSFASFDERCRKIDQKKAQMAGGYSARVTREGLIVFRPKRSRSGFSIRGLAMLVLGVFAFKGLVLAHLGSGLYGERVASLAEGTAIEKAGAFVMQADPISQEIAKLIGMIL